MIDVLMNLDSFGLGKKITQLARIKIWNDGTGSKNVGNYKYEIRGKSNRLMKAGMIAGFPRKAKHSVKLLQLVLDDAYPNT